MKADCYGRLCEREKRIQRGEFFRGGEERPADLEGEHQEERPLSGVVTLQDLASPLCEQRGRVLPLLAPGHTLTVVEVVPTDAGAVTGLVAAGRMREMCEPETEQQNPSQFQPI